MSSDLYDELMPWLDSASGHEIRETPVGTGRRAWSFCLCHADGTKHGRRSLSLHPLYGLDCFAGCAFKDVVTAIRERAGVHPVRPAPTGAAYRGGHGNSGKPGRITAASIYESEGGEPLFRVVRREHEDGSKDFLQQHPAGRGECCGLEAAEPCKPAEPGWRWGRGGARWVLYRLPQLLASAPSQFVFLVEGEACAAAVADLGLVATTNPGGAGKWRDEYTESLKGRYVAVLPDNDRPGLAHAEQVGAALLPVAAQVRYVVLPGLAYKGDVKDWLEAGGTKERLLALVGGAPVARLPSEMFPKAVDTRVLDATRAGP